MVWWYDWHCSWWAGSSAQRNSEEIGKGCESGIEKVPWSNDWTAGKRDSESIDEFRLTKTYETLIMIVNNYIILINYLSNMLKPYIDSYLKRRGVLDISKAI